MAWQGGVEGRRARYEANFAVLKSGMSSMGFGLFLAPELQGCIISTFLIPDDANWCEIIYAC
jgi:2-aminoethylphosphonate-pyruvate transaminase